MDRFFSIATAGLIALSCTIANATPMTNRKYSDVRNFLTNLAAQNPSTVHLFSLGVSDSKEEILGAKIGDGAIHNLVVATHHGNEYGSTELAVAFAESLAANPILGQTIYVIPVLNINGYNSRSRQEVDSRGAWRDPNRDYPGPCGTEGPFTLKSTRALAALVESENIINSATLHTFYPAVVYPWGISSPDLDTAYPEIFRQMVNDATADSHYQTGNSSEVIYPADGCFEDYAYWKLGVWSLLFELGTSHNPSVSDLIVMIEKNIPGLRRMLTNAPTQLALNHGFSGRCDESLRSLDRHDE